MAAQLLQPLSLFFLSISAAAKYLHRRRHCQKEDTSVAGPLTTLSFFSNNVRSSFGKGALLSADLMLLFGASKYLGSLPAVKISVSTARIKVYLIYSLGKLFRSVSFTGFLPHTPFSRVSDIPACRQCRGRQTASP